MPALRRSCRHSDCRYWPGGAGGSYRGIEIRAYFNRGNTKLHFKDKSGIDIINALAFPLPIMVIAELLGIPAADREQFRNWTSDMIGTDYELKMKSFGKMGAYFDGIIAEHMRTPRENLISELLAAQIGG